jgi:hypothetical protein
MIFIENKKIKFILFIIIFIQLFYVSHNRLKFKIEIIKNSFLEGFGSKYIMTDDLLELKKISKDLKLNKFNISKNLEKNTFFNQRSIEFLYPIKFDKNFKKFFYKINDKIPYHCTLLGKYEYLVIAQC